MFTTSWNWRRARPLHGMRLCQFVCSLPQRISTEKNLIEATRVRDSNEKIIWSHKKSCVNPPRRPKRRSQQLLSPRAQSTIESLSMRPLFYFFFYDVRASRVCNNMNAKKKLLVWGEKEQIIECWKEEEEEEEKKRERRWFGNKLVRSVGKPPDAIHVWKELSRVVVFLFPPRRERRSAGNYQRLATHNIIVARPF